MMGLLERIFGRKKDKEMRTVTMLMEGARLKVEMPDHVDTPIEGKTTTEPPWNTAAYPVDTPVEEAPVPEIHSFQTPEKHFFGHLAKETPKELDGIEITGNGVIRKEDFEERVKEIAYWKWEEAGSPEGKDEEFWYAAEQEVRAS